MTHGALKLAWVNENIKSLYVAEFADVLDSYCLDREKPPGNTALPFFIVIHSRPKSIADLLISKIEMKDAERYNFFSSFFLSSRHRPEEWRYAWRQARILRLRGPWPMGIPISISPFNRFHSGRLDKTRVKNLICSLLILWEHIDRSIFHELEGVNHISEDA